MLFRTLFEDFSSLGMTPREISEATAPLGGKVDGVDHGDVDGIGYLFSGSANGSVDEGYVKLRSLAVRKKAAKAARLRRKSGAGKAEYLNQLRLARSSMAKTKKRKHYKLVMARGGPKKGHRFMTASVEDPGKGLEIMSEKLLESVMQLAEAIDRDPQERFDEYVEAFNHIADIGELAAMQLMEDDEEAARDILNLSLAAESVLKYMEGLGGSLEEDEDAELEETLAEAMESVGDYMAEYGFLVEGSEDGGDGDDDDEDEIAEDDADLLSAFTALREAKAAKAKKMGAARGKKVVSRVQSPKSRKIMTAKGIKRKKGSSAWGKRNTSPNASRKQIMNRGDVRDTEKLLGYLRQVKMGKVAPGQPLG